MNERIPPVRAMRTAASITLVAAYEHDSVPLVRQRLQVFCGIFIVFMGLGSAVEVINFPERSPWSWIAYLCECATTIVGVLAAQYRAGTWHPSRVGTWMSATLMGCILVYHALVMAPAQRIVMTLGTVLAALSVIVPWGLRPQIAVGVAAVVATSVAIWAGRLPVEHEALLMPSTALLASASIACVGALLLDRYRFEAFRRTTMQTEEAEITAGLLTVTQALNAHFHEPDMLEQVTGRSLAALGCDFSTVFLLQPERQVYTLAAVSGLPPDLRDNFAYLELTHDALPLFAHFHPGKLVAIEDARHQALVPMALMDSLRTASALVAPLGRHEEVLGVLVAGYHLRTGPFSDKERRLTAGIAQATTMALANSRLVSELEAANRLKSEFVATMSHELRTPLNIIAGYAEMVEDCIFEPGSVGWIDAVRRIRRSTEELNDLVGATLDLNRFDTGRDPVDRQVVDLGQLLAKVENDVEPLVQLGVALRWQLTLEDRQVLTDGVKLRTILKNLVVNALKFTTAGTVDVTVCAEHTALVLCVRDTGIGIPAEHLTTIFEMFRQLDGSSTRRFGGVGLGLHIVKRLVGMLDGEISVDSIPEVGSTFHVRLPGAVVVQADPRSAHGV